MDDLGNSAALERLYRDEFSMIEDCVLTYVQHGSESKEFQHVLQNSLAILKDQTHA